MLVDKVENNICGMEYCNFIANILIVNDKLYMSVCYYILYCFEYQVFIKNEYLNKYLFSLINPVNNKL